MTDAPLGESMLDSEPQLPLMADGALPPLQLLLHWCGQRAREGANTIAIPGLPPGNGILPKVAELCRVDQFRCDEPCLPSHWTWVGGDGTVAATNRGADMRKSGHLHQGHLPVSSDGTDLLDKAGERLLGLVEMARLADASACISRSIGADWSLPLAALGDGRLKPPPARTQVSRFENGPMRAWNPLPFARRCVVALPPDGGTPPWSVLDQHGAQHPLQVVEGPLGPQWITELQLGGLECVDLRPCEEPLAGSHWEVSQTVIDNGRVRAELDAEGRIARCCFDGRFVAIRDALVVPELDGAPISGDTTIRILEAGPTRARVGVTIDSPAGTARITYTLVAGDDILQVTAGWHGRSGSRLVLRHPLNWPGAELRCAAEGPSWTSPTTATITDGRPATQRGLRWAVARAGDEAIGLIGSRPFSVEPDGLGVAVGPGLVYGIGDGVRHGDQLPLAQAALALAVPGRHAGRTPVSPPLVRIEPAGLCLPLWTSHPKGWIAELTVVEQHGNTGRLELYPDPRFGALQEAWTVDLHGKRLTELATTKEGDAWVLPVAANALQLVRFR